MLLSKSSTTSALHITDKIKELSCLVKICILCVVTPVILNFKKWNGGMLTVFFSETVFMLLSNLSVMEAGSLPWSDLFSNSIPYFLESVIVWDKLMLWLLYIKIFCPGAMLLNLKLSSHPVLVWHASSLSFIYVNYIVY